MRVSDRMTSYDARTSGTSHSSIVAAVEDGGSYSSTCQLWSADCDKGFECTEHSADPNSSSAVPGLWSHTAQRSTHLLQEFGWEVFNHQPPYSPDLAPSDFHLFLHLKKFLSGQRQRFQNDREVTVMSVTQWFQSQAADFYDTRYKSWSHGMINFSIPEVNMLKNVGNVAQAARYLTTGWTARVQSRVSEAWRFFFTLSCPDWPWGQLNLV